MGFGYLFYEKVTKVIYDDKLNKLSKEYHEFYMTLLNETDKITGFIEVDKYISGLTSVEYISPTFNKKIYAVIYNTSMVSNKVYVDHTQIPLHNILIEKLVEKVIIRNDYLQEKNKKIYYENKGKEADKLINQLIKETNK